MKKLFAAIAALPLLSGAALAAQPLTPAQMDDVTAGAAAGISLTLAALAQGGANALAQTAFEASITQTPVVLKDDFGNVTVPVGTALVAFAVTASN